VNIGEEEDPIELPIPVRPGRAPETAPATEPKPELVPA
jgi:hypothetical protein